MAVFFCSSLISCFPGMLLRYYLSNFEMVPVAPDITGITSVFTFHMRCISVVNSFYFKISSASFFITFIFSEISIHRHFSFSFLRFMLCRLLLGIFLSVFNCWFHNIIILPSWNVGQPRLQIQQLRSSVREVVTPDKGNCRRLRKGTAVSESFPFITSRLETEDRLNLSDDTPVNDTPINVQHSTCAGSSLK